MILMKRIALLHFAFIIAVSGISQKLSYSVSFPNIAHHEARVSLEVTNAGTAPLVFRMSRSSPGRYATHEFGKNVYDVTATNGLNKSLVVKRVDADVYQVSNHDGSVVFSYTLYGNYADGTYAGIDPASIHLNMPASFIWVKGFEKAPVDIRFQIPDSSFSIATQLKPSSAKHSFTAPNLQYFMDSPVKIGKLQWREWPVTVGSKKMTIRIAVETDAPATAVDTLSEIVKRITEQARAVYKTYPSYDYGTYTFLASFNPYVKGDGMEHRNSTMITLPFNLVFHPDVLDVFAHEFFHCWNVERIRPKTLEPFNFEKSNMSNELWCAEGFTQYYGVLVMVRAGLISEADYAGTLSNLVNNKLNTPGARLYTPVQSSNMAVFTDAGVSIDRTNYRNIFTSYYNYGAALALALDLELRTRFNKSLDEFMQQMWKQHGAKEIPYTVADMQQALAAVTNSSYAKKFFDNYVYASKSPPYHELLAAAGYELKTAAAGKAWIGDVAYKESDGLIILGNTLRNTPLYDAGLDVDDVIISIDSQRLKTESVFMKLLGTHKPGDRLQVKYLHRGEEKTTVIVTAENNTQAVIPYEHSRKTMTAAMQDLRKQWLGGTR
jgi:predicted metalloprotease with PDZ domain